jgi:2,4-diaminopentanoate dehydrogenase
MAREVRVLHCGLGTIGQGIARLVLNTPGLRIVGAADTAPELAGRDLGQVLALPRKLRVKVEADLSRLLRKTPADVAILSTSSTLPAVREPLEALIQRRLPVISTCEQLSSPTPQHKATFQKLDRLARKKKVAVLSTGVNPGFVMDTLALIHTAPCARVERVAVTRVVDAAHRRLSLQRKVGAGLTVSQFRRAHTEGTVGHVGLRESVYMIAAGLGWKLDRIEETLEPAIAPRDLDTEHIRVPAGAVAGIKQYARAYRNGDIAISLDLQMYVGAETPRDHVVITGEPPVDMTIKGGVAGDVATAAIVVNCIPKVLTAAPGVLTMRDLPLLHHLNPLELKGVAARR